MDSWLLPSPQAAAQSTPMAAPLSPRRDGRDRAAIDEPAYLPFGEAKLGGDLADGEQFRRTCGDRRGHSSV